MMDADSQPSELKRKRRVRYSGTHPRRLEEKYKEINPGQYPETLSKVLASGKTPAGMHRPIMVEEILELLDPKPGELVLDVTLGYGGHASEILKRILPGGRLIGLDTDPIELPKTEARLRANGMPEEALAVRSINFAGVQKVLAELEIDRADLLLADLGVSSMQLDDPGRGFSFKFDGPLDLRMNPEKGISGAELLRRIQTMELARILRENADEPQAERLAEAILERQRFRPITTTHQLVEIVRRFAGPERGNERSDDTVRRVFQALRIEVNDEFGALDNLLRILPSIMVPGGRVAILTFHSGEDRRVKKAFLGGKNAGIFSRISEDVIRPTAEEVRSNPRASSAKLRWAIRSEVQ
jgi:16S rRNA (cytosine1402-N4)-methyltransferase